MKSLLFRLILGWSCLSASSPLMGENLPTLPPSSRVLTTQEVKNFWINTLQAKSFPSRPLGLHPQAQASWDRTLMDRNDLIRSIRAGQWDTEAELAKLEHNAAAWRRLGNQAQADVSERKLRELREHLARLATLAVLRQAAEAQIDAAGRIRQIEAEISALRDEIDRCH